MSEHINTADLSQLVSIPGDIVFKSSDGKYLNLNDDNYGVLVDKKEDATLFGRMAASQDTSDKASFFVVNSGKWATYYLSYSGKGYLGSYRWANARAFAPDSGSGCYKVDGETWKTFISVSSGVSYIRIGNYQDSYVETCLTTESVD